MVKFMKGRNSGACYRHHQAGGGTHNFLPEPTVKSSSEYLPAAIPWTSHTET